MLQRLDTQDYEVGQSPAAMLPRRLDWLLLAAGMGISYMLVARLGMLLSLPPEQIALFWPASGLAAGTLIATGPRARAPFAVGIFLATLLADLATRSNVGASLVIAMCNAGECLTVAAIVGRLEPRAAGFEQLRGVVVFIGAAAVAAALAAVPAALALQLFAVSPSPLSTLWFVWFKSDAIGIITVAPLFITMGMLGRERLAPWKLAEGIAAVMLTGVATVYALVLTPDYIGWKVVAPATVLFPLLLWLATRAKPVFTAAAICLYALVVTGIVWSGHGWLGDPAMPLSSRVLSGQVGILTFAACGLSLSAIVTHLGNIARDLQITEERLRQGLNAGSVYVFDFEPAKRRGHRFGSLAERLQLPAVGRMGDYAERLHPDDKARFELAMRSLTPSEPNFSQRFRLRAQDGDYRVVAHRAEASFDAAGNFIRLVGTCVDITPQAQVEQALRDSEERLQLGLNAGSVYAFDLDFAKRRVYRFGGLIDRLGLPAEGILEEYGDRLHPGDRARFEHRFKSITTDAPYFSERFRLRTTDGDYLYVVHRAEGTFDADGTLIRVVGTCADVTERQRAEQALRDGEARLETALRMGQVFAFDWDVTTNAVRRSENAAEILGVTAAEVQMSRQVFAGYVHPEDCERMARDVAEMVPTAPVNNTRFRFLRPDKRVAWLEISQGGTFDASGRLIRVTGLTRDVTERQIAEERQVRLIEELNHRVKNTLARVSVVIERSRDGQSSIDDYVAALDGRIKSMARTQERLSDSKWDGVDIATLVDDELTPYRTQSNTSVEGPDIVLAADAAQAVSLTLHELATNAAKHGALGSGGGHVTVRWRLEDLPSREPASKPEQVMRLEWSEATGREMSTTPKEGFGVSTIRGLTSFELEADVALEFSATGVCCTLVIPAERLFHRAPDPTRAGPLAINPSASAAEVR